MPTTTRTSSDTSVAFSLAELAKIEDERVREEDQRHARAREQEARARREAESRKRAEEEALLAAQAEAAARRRQEEAAQKARAEARERAALEVARIEEQAKARLEADNAARAHELAVLRVRTEGGRRRLQTALAVALGLVVCGGSAAAYAAARHAETLEQTAEQWRAGQSALAREREHAKETELAALDRRHGALRARPLAREGEGAGATAEAARRAIDPKTLDQDRLRAFSDALDAFQARLDTVERIAVLEQRHADLTAWAAERPKSDLVSAAASAAARAKQAGTDDASLTAYGRALDRLREALARPAGGGGSGSKPPPALPTQATCADPLDPLCGLNGRPL